MINTRLKSGDLRQQMEVNKLSYNYGMGGARLRPSC